MTAESFYHLSLRAQEPRLTSEVGKLLKKLMSLEFKNRSLRGAFITVLIESVKEKVSKIYHLGGSNAQLGR